MHMALQCTEFTKLAQHYCQHCTLALMHASYCLPFSFFEPGTLMQAPKVRVVYSNGLPKLCVGINSLYEQANI